MYIMTCDGYTLLDARYDEYILGNPKIKTEVNTVGEGSFKIYYNHPNIEKLFPLRSIFEVKDEYGVLFRGRMTEDTKDFDNCKDVDLEGAMSYFNDSVVRPYVFPDDFVEDASYISASENGKEVEFYLSWLISQHNAQVEPFQQFKLGNVVGFDGQSINRASSDYPSTWKELDGKLFNSTLGGFLCIRYAKDGNYIDYLAEFTEENEQGITYGENMLDISQNANASGTYSAIIPLGAESSQSNGEVYEGMYGDIVGGSTSKLTIKNLPDCDVTDDIVKIGDVLYSKSAVSAYGWRFAPRDETTWDDVTETNNLLNRGIDFLNGDSTKIPNTIKVTAVDLNCTDAQIRSFRIYKKINVYTQPHGINNKFDLTALDIDLLAPQNTKITVGKTIMSFTQYQSKTQKTFTNDLSNYVTTVANKIAKTEQNISAQLETKVDVEDNDQVVEMVNNADAVVRLIGRRITIESDNFTLNEDGTITATNANISGVINVKDGGKVGNWNVTDGSMYATFEAGGLTKAIWLGDDGVRLYDDFSTPQAYTLLDTTGIMQFKTSGVGTGCSWANVIAKCK